MRNSRQPFRRSLNGFHALEERRLLAGDVVGAVTNDTDGDGVGETVSVGTPVLLFADAGADGLFSAAETNAGAADSVVTDASGNYRFTNVVTGDYFVVLGTLTNQIEINAAATPTLVSVSDVAITIDEFEGAQSVQASTAGPLMDDDPDGTNANAGGDRDLYAEITANNGPGLLEITSDFLGGEILNIASTGDVSGIAQIVWDGTDASATVVDADGLSLDLSNGGANDAFLINAASDQTVQLTVRMYSGVGNISEISQTLVGTDGAVNGDPDELITLDFADFLNGGLAGTTITGTGVDFSDVGAIEIEFDSTGSAAFDAQLDVVGIIGDTDGPDFEVQNQMSLGDLVFLDMNNNGMFDAADDTGIDGVLVTLLEANDIDGLFDDVVSSQRTSGGGGYLFTGLAPGDYKVRIDETNFNLADADTDDALVGLFSSTGNDDGMGMAPDPDDDNDDGKDRGTLDGADVCSKPITLVGGQELFDSGNGARNVDFGFYGFDLRIVKTPDTQAAAAGETVTYTLTPNNQRPTGNPGNLGTDAANVVVTDTLPTGLTFEAASSTAGGVVTTVGGREVVTYNIGDLAAGTTGAPITVVARLDAGLLVAPAENNEARIANTDEPAVFDNSNVVTDQEDNVDVAAITLTPPDVDLAITKSVTPDTTVDPGTTVTYTVAVTNQVTSNATATSYDLIDDLPTGLTYVDTLTAGLPAPVVTATATGTRLTYIGLPALAVGATQTIQYRATIDADYVGVDLVNDAEITNIAPNDSNVANNEDTATINLARTLPSKRSFIATWIGLS